jgi:ATP-binding cassette subfamily B protein
MNISKQKIRLSSFWFLLNYIKPYKKLSLIGLSSILLIAITTLAMGFGLKTFLNEDFYNHYHTALMCMSLVVIIFSAATYTRYLSMSSLSEQIVGDVRKTMYDHTLTLDPVFFEHISVGEILSRITVDTTFIQHLVSTTFPIALRNLLMAVSGCISLYLINSTLTFFLMVLIPMILVVMHSLGKRIRRFSANTQALVGHVNEYLEETLNAVRTVQAFCHEEFDRKTFHNRLNASIDGAFQRIKVRSLLSALIVFFIFGGLIAILWIGIDQVKQGDITIGDLASFLFFGLTVAGSINNFIEVISDFQKAAGACDRIQDLFDMKSSVIVTAPPQPVQHTIEGAISFKNVQFAYSHMTDSQALIDFNIDINPGEKLAVVGPSGSGKSTLVHLLLRFYDPTRGTISIDNIDLRDFNLQELRAHIGFVAQEPIIFSGTVYDNIRYGRPDATFEDIQKAADAAMVIEFMDRLSKGLYTPIGKKGVSLSTGQKQRIAIARAILRDPKILLLDEATSALDANNEYYVQAALNKLMAGRTTLMIAHRLSTIAQADKIIVLNNGRIEEVGTHSDLLTNRGLYYKLLNLQMMTHK